MTFTEALLAHMRREPEQSNGFLSRAYGVRIETIRRLRKQIRGAA
jgi:hypothetical protein